MAEFDVVIIGGGVTGLSAAWHLNRLGCDRLLLLSPSRPQASSDLTPGFALAGWLDNMTRWHHAFGAERSVRFWQVALDAFRCLQELCRDLHVMFAVGDRYHLGLDLAQEQELKLASELLVEMGLSSQYVEGATLGSSVARTLQKSHQRDRQAAAILDVPSLKKKLRSSLHNICHFRSSVCHNIEFQPDQVRLHTSSGEIRAEIVVVAAHTEIPKLLPALPADSLVPYVDQWHELKLQQTLPDWLSVGDFLAFQYGHAWMSVLDADRVCLGGARYLRALAGIGQSRAVFLPKVAKHLEQRWSDILAWGIDGKPARKRSLVGLRACDELPLIGPAPFDGRALLAGGYMGQGLSLGVWAGKCLAELIQCGISEELPRDFWPARLRSIDQGKPT